MPFKTLKTKRAPLTLEELAASIERRKAEWRAREETVIDMAELGGELAARREAGGIPQLPRNAGTDRTPSKQALLDEIAKLGAKW
ncbi:hypothetical protein [Novosphingobium sp. fls2-241-R2A-195]|uniref:hypothetical protein n=1 Tax=Novosphingobium sp. fls2-241-R2A-195 TaxID=3040296 RepID=UPI00254DFEBD|nr:hypothetical protein [Novosphingobium sp. fls2-241-R2A-195]